MKSIEIIVTTSGEIQIEAIGFQGQGCAKATGAIEAALGTAKQRRKKPEYDQQTRVAQGQRA